MAKSTRILVLALLLFAYSVAADGDTEPAVGSTDPVTFEFSDEVTAAAPSNNETVQSSFWSEPAPESETLSEDPSFADEETTASVEPIPAIDEGSETLNENPSFADEESTTSVEEPEDVVFTTDSTFDGANTTSVGDSEGGFDMVEGVDGASSAEDSELGDLSLASSSTCWTGNPVDDCWRCDPNWASHRQSLANCAVGFGRYAIGGKNGRIYVVTSSRDDDPASPAPGTLRYAVTRPGPLWITFAYSMTIKLKNELMITSFKTIDGRGANVRIVGGAGLTLQYVSNVIVHGITITDIKPTGPARIMTSTSHVGKRGRCDGDAISIFTSKNIWIDHCYLARAADGLVDVIRGSTAVSITNNYFTQHDKVMLLGAHATDYADRNMYVTVAYNVFGPGLVQRMPRVRFGNVHVCNNDYTSGWSKYAIGGSEAPTILSQGNLFNPYKGRKQVTQRIDDGGPTYGGPGTWNWRSEGDQFLAGSFFTQVRMQWTSRSYAKTVSTAARPVSMVTRMVRGAGPLACRKGYRC